MFENYKYKNFLIERYLKLFGKEETQKLLDANEKPLKKAIRINTLKIPVKECLQRLEKKGFVFSPVAWCDYGFIVEKSRFSIGATPEFLLGYYYVQDSTSMIPPLELNPAPGEIIADVAAAPGGKTTHLSQIMDNKGIIVAADINLNKMQALRSNVERCGVKNVFAVNLEVNKLGTLGVQFDKILLDAPCSSEGAIIKIKERRNTIKPGDFDYYSEKQKSLVDYIRKILKKNGILVYSTCSIAPEENELVIQHAINNGFELLDLSNKYCSPGITEFFGKTYSKELKKCGRFFPHIHNTQGFFVAKLRKL